MSNFNDDEDKKLFQLAKRYVGAGRNVSWKAVAKIMQKDRSVLSGRFRTLKAAYGSDFEAFPRRFHTARKPKAKCVLAARRPTACVVLSENQINDLMLLVRQTSSPLEASAAFSAIQEIFGAVKADNVRHSGAHVSHNAGKLSFTGTSKMIGAIGQISIDDVFLDIGSGVGNIIVQVAL